jgi:CRISPR-associated protein Cas1
LRLGQAKCFFDAGYPLGLAKQIASGKIGAQVGFIKEHRFTDGFDWRSRVEAMLAMQAHLTEQQTMDGVRGVEGGASRLYFECLGAMLTKLSFGGRSRRPALDEPNALLNLGYAFLCNECAAALEICGLDTSIGFLHGIVYGRQSLALDLMELFRADATDRLAVRLINWGMLGAQAFKQDDKIGFRLTDAGFRIFMEQYEQHMTGETGRRAQIRTAAESLRKAILEQKPWQPPERKP